ncbi:coatomer delta subunit Ret2 [Schizosaccharomyces japonicus yFS275]|uniref:Coatomer subunit delta n=1 Tax=Schizosaccharomyces japonicus (strain yFS275 / FY16936) TaxID=402676 RepID=B6K2L5_SCHJY|nr:coatomer delta subunit Ret2 [Schizosaccharomyces japonicus yFS275]EEB07396.2 coatomer delta subunit Ret2 [Schizosaccharomyces japonicus yFS275]
MVVLAAGIVNRGGKAVLSRQFRDMSRTRVESLLSTFPGLISKGTQHTSVETENVRFVYQPLDELYMVLITNKQSNILEDIETLHLFNQAVTSMSSTADERDILENAFEILCAFDEITSLGYRDNVSLSQIKKYLEMESHEEKIQEIVSRNKELEANEERKRRIKQLELQRKESSRRGFGSDSYESGGYQAVSNPVTAEVKEEVMDYYYTSSERTAPGPKVKGMQLGKKGRSNL